MKESLRLALLAPLALGAGAPAAAEADADKAKASPQSIECFYPPASRQGDTAVLCTVRLHVSAPKGGQLWMQGGEDVPPAPLTGKDAAGNILIGIFREWEACFDSTGGCGIMVYDFFSRPHGDWLAFDTWLAVPVTHGEEQHCSAVFSLKEPATLSVSGRSFVVTPFPEESPHAVLSVEYAADDGMADISFLNEKGTPLPCSIVEAVEEGAPGEGRRCTTTYSLPGKAERACLRLHLHGSREMARVPLRFKAAIGSPYTGGSASGRKP